MEESTYSFSYTPVRGLAGEVEGLLCRIVETTGLVFAERKLRDLNDTLEQQVEERTEQLRLYRDIVESDTSPILAFDRDYRPVGFNRAHTDDFLKVMGHHQQVGEVLPDLFRPSRRLHCVG